MGWCSWIRLVNRILKLQSVVCAAPAIEGSLGSPATASADGITGAQVSSVASSTVGVQLSRDYSTVRVYLVVRVLPTTCAAHAPDYSRTAKTHIHPRLHEDFW